MRNTAFSSFHLAGQRTTDRSKDFVLSFQRQTDWGLVWLVQSWARLNYRTNTK